MNKWFAWDTIDGAWIETPEVGVTAGKDLVDSYNGWKGYFWEVYLLAVEMKVLVLVSENERSDSKGVSR